MMVEFGLPDVRPRALIDPVPAIPKRQVFTTLGLVS